MYELVFKISNGTSLVCSVSNGRTYDGTAPVVRALANKALRICKPFNEEEMGLAARRWCGDS
jgi:hypothetical protein